MNHHIGSQMECISRKKGNEEQSSCSSSRSSASPVTSDRLNANVDIDGQGGREDDEEPKKPDGWGTRHTFAVLGFLGFVASYAMRVNLSIAIVSMVGNSTSCKPKMSPKCRAFSESTYTNEFSSNDQYDSFNWDKKDQGIILGAFFWGYVATQVPGGMLAKKIGGKWPFGIGMLVTAIFSLVTPLAAHTGKGALIFVRIIQGFGEGVTNPSMHALLSKWVPPLERSKIGSFVYAGMQMGTVVAMPLSGYLISSGFLQGWPSVFYVFGVMGIIWFIAWSFLVYDTPAKHPRIAPKELSYIQHRIGAEASKHELRTPWKKILTSTPVIAILVAQTGHGWGLYTLLTELPTYMENMMHFDIKKSSVLSALPYFVQWVVAVFCSWCADYLRERRVLSTASVRKVFNTAAHWIPALLLVGTSYSGEDKTLTVILLTLAVGINGAAWASFQVNHIDISPNHAAVLMGITNGFANLCGIAAPFIAGVILNDDEGASRWQIIFFIAAAIYFLDNLFYICFASGEEQSWNRESRVGHLTTNIDTETSREPLLSVV